MFIKRDSIFKATEMGCCGCFGFAFARKSKKVLRPPRESANRTSRDFLLDEEVEEYDDESYNGDFTETDNRDDSEFQSPVGRSEDVLKYRIQNGLICRDVPVRETVMLVRSEDEDGNKMINEYVRLHKIGSGSYGKVVLYRSTADGKYYAMKAFHKSHLLKLRVAPSETAMTDVLREVMIMKSLKHPNIVNLVEVIDDPTTDHFYMVLEYVDGKRVCEGAGLPGGLGENTARKYLRDIVCGLMYLHSHNVIHGDLKPDNLLVTASGTVKIGDFSVSQVFEDDNDELRRSPGTPVFTAPECCLGLTYHGKIADTWALGVTLYCLILGEYPFLGDTLQDTYDKIVHDPINLPDGMNPLLKDLIQGLLCKDPEQRLKLEAVSKHAWVIGEEGSLPLYPCWCKRNISKVEEEVSNERNISKVEEEISNERNISKVEEEVSNERNISKVEEEISNERNISKVAEEVSNERNISKVEEEVSNERNISKVEEEVSNERNISKVVEEVSNERNISKVEEEVSNGRNVSKVEEEVSNGRNVSNVEEEVSNERNVSNVEEEVPNGRPPDLLS